MISKAEFYKIEQAENEALSFYQTLYNELKDETILKKVDRLIKEELKHVAMMKRVIELINKKQV